ncbi:PaaI family thioesterase [Nocardia sp. NPDC052254]|uniref:PaaI family thioesterase n=1 Tax=Nocardia sp. NPDC052254 TaxID=3155681 RepID=UPI00343979C8
MKTTRPASTEQITAFMDYIGFRSTLDADGTRIWELPVAPHVVNTSGGLQGGLIATLVDVAAGTVALQQRPSGSGVVTSDLHVRYFRAVTAGAAQARTRIVHSGRRSVVVEVEVVQPGCERPVALATVSFATVEFDTGARSSASAE